MTMQFKKAEKHLARLRLALCGPSGSGKTMSALRLAKGLGGRVAVIDTERGSASLYADRFDFDVLELMPPFQPSRYVEAIKAAEAAGYDIVLIDSLSHAWAGEGGVLETVDGIAAKSGNKFTAWNPATKAQNAMVNAFMGTACHVIATMRSKMEYAQEKDNSGKTVIRKLGLAPVQRDGVEYEFGVVLDVGMDHRASVGLAGKDRTGLFADQEPRILTEADGVAIRNWLASAPPAEVPVPPSPPKPAQAPASSTNAPAVIVGDPDLALLQKAHALIAVASNGHSWRGALEAVGVKVSDKWNEPQDERDLDQMRSWVSRAAVEKIIALCERAQAGTKAKAAEKSQPTAAAR